MMDFDVPRSAAGEQRDLDWISNRVIPEPNSGCWIWLGSLNDGYGQITVGRKTVKVHRLAWQLTNGAIPAGLELDHKCRVRCCCNPHHLEPVTHKENVHRGASPQLVWEPRRAVTHCPMGHPYSGGNLRIRPSGARVCRACHLTHSRNSRAARKATDEKMKEAMREP